MKVPGLPLTFLERGKKYLAHVYSDDERISTRTNVGIEVRNVDAGVTLEVPLKTSPGARALRAKSSRPSSEFFPCSLSMTDYTALRVSERL